MSNDLDLSSTKPPREYKCSKCGIHGCKLWRGVLLDATRLMCCDCAGCEERVDVSMIRRDGKVTYESEGDNWTDRIGGMHPAIPIRDCNSFWDYIVVPRPWVQWWKNLPNRAGDKEMEDVTIHGVSSRANDFLPDWKELFTPEEAERELSGFKFKGPGSYIIKSGSVIVIPSYTTNKYWFYVYDGRSPADAFNEIVNLPVQVDER